MPVFAYTAKSADGKVMQGQSEAESPSLLRQRLAEQGMTVQNVKEAKKKPAKPAASAQTGGGTQEFLDRFQRVKLSDLVSNSRSEATS